MIIVSDFDGTITKHDVIDEFLSAFADNKWKIIEEDWRQGKISSKNCLEQQLLCVDRISIKDINNFLFKIELDPYFKEFADKVDRKGWKIYIVSDGFDFFIEQILFLNNILNVEIFANTVRYRDNKLKIFFPHFSDKCNVASGICKCHIYNRLKEANKREKFVYLGDGLSDFCVAETLPEDDFLFAKGELSLHLYNTAKDFIPFNTFREINYYLADFPPSFEKSFSPHLNEATV